MAYFPIFEDLNGQKCLVIGGGRVALRKIRRLLPFGPRITAVAPAFCPELEAMEDIRRIASRYEPGMEDGAFLVIAATDDGELNRAICRSCSGKRIPVNCATGAEEGSFLFPALIKKGLLTIGISSGGAGPGAAVGIRDRVDAVLPSHTEEILDRLQELRPKLIRQIPDTAVRGRVLRRIFEASAALDRPLTEEETEEILNEYSK